MSEPDVAALPNGLFGPWGGSLVLKKPYTRTPAADSEVNWSQNSPHAPHCVKKKFWLSPSLVYPQRKNSTALTEPSEPAPRRTALDSVPCRQWCTSIIRIWGGRGEKKSKPRVRDCVLVACSEYKMRVFGRTAQTECWTTLFCARLPSSRTSGLASGKERSRRPDVR